MWLHHVQHRVVAARAAHTHNSSPAIRGTVREYVVVSFRCWHARGTKPPVQQSDRQCVTRMDCIAPGAIFSPCSSLRLAGCMISTLHSPRPTRPISLTSNPQCSTSASGAGCGPWLCARPGEMSCYSLEVAYSRWSHCRRACTASRAPVRCRRGAACSVIFVHAPCRNTRQNEL